ncbi:MAG: hypothetical protein B6I22_08780 [Desulfobacteraceae bacterium 4572_123]|nr:MAG: hypothetical protein B6I22_08780 [Desulfobacteraceae bacterium 4572_123]
MIVKFIQYWDVLSEREEEFRKFIVKSYIPGINETGFLKIVESWHVASGEGPFNIMEGVADSVESVNNLLQLDEFQKLNHLLHFLVTNYKTKLLVPTGPVEGIVPEHITCRFNHHYNINYDKYDDYTKFIKKEHIPGMEHFGLTIVGCWNVAVGATPYVIDETRAEDLATIGEMLENPAYQQLTLKLLKLVSNYGCKILVPSGHINT